MMLDKKLLNVKRPLIVKQMSRVSLVALVTTGIFIIILIFYFAQQRRNDYNEQLNSIAESVRLPLSFSVWNNRLDSVQRTLDGLSSMHILMQATVIIPAQYKSINGNFPGQSKVPRFFAHLFDLPVTVAIPLYAPDLGHPMRQPIAWLVLEADSYDIYQYILRISCAMLLAFLVLSLLPLFLISWSMSRLLVKPLRAIAVEMNTMNKASPGQLIVQPKHKDDEIGMLIRNYNYSQSELLKAYQELSRLSTRDTLTDLPNAALFDELLKQYLVESQKENKVFSILHIGITSLKEATGALGQSFSDQKLITIANRLKNDMREQNILARVADDEFAVLAKNCTTSLHAMLLAQDLLKTITGAIELSDLTLLPSVSIGIALYPDDGADDQQLIRNAHSAMVSAKQQGMNNILFFEPHLTSEIQQRLTMQSEILHGIHHDEFQIYLQPQIDMRTGQVIGAEALLRWFRSDGLAISPADFIPLAEETGLILPLGDQVLERVFVILSNWQQRRIPISLSVNLSAVQIQRDDFIDVFKALLSRYPIKPDQLILEITETARIDYMEKVLALLQKIHALGFSIALDDFGMGYAGLSYLRLLYIDKLKIDKSFINTLPDDADLVRVISSIADVFKLDVIAEGIETESQRQWLLTHNIFFGQGYLFDKALSMTDFEQRYLQHYH